MLHSNFAHKLAFCHRCHSRCCFLWRLKRRLDLWLSQVSQVNWEWSSSDVVGVVVNRLWGVCCDTYDRKLSRQCLSSRPLAINSRSIWRSSFRISRPLAALARRFSILSLVNFPWRRLAAEILARPLSVLGTVLLPPWRWHRPIFGLPMRWQGLPERAFAKHKLSKRFLRSHFIEWKILICNFYYSKF